MNTLEVIIKTFDNVIVLNFVNLPSSDEAVLLKYQSILFCAESSHSTMQCTQTDLFKLSNYSEIVYNWKNILIANTNIIVIINKNKCLYIDTKFLNSF